MAIGAGALAVACGGVGALSTLDYTCEGVDNLSACTGVTGFGSGATLAGGGGVGSLTGAGATLAGGGVGVFAAAAYIDFCGALCGVEGASRTSSSDSSSSDVFCSVNATISVTSSSPAVMSNGINLYVSGRALAYLDSTIATE